jgi:hypothetical protein
MKNLRIWTSVGVLALVAMSSVGLSRAQDQGVRAPAAPQDTVSAGFTYQAQLKDSEGNLVTDTCDLHFSLWDAASAGNKLGSDCILSDVEVDDGNFAVVVNSGGEFGADAFTGAARWLEIGIQCSGDSAWSYLPGRQLLSAAPYALSLRPGATVSGAGGDGPVLKVINQAGGTALYAAGDVAQDATAAGLVKAAVYVDCKGTFPSPPHRYFNTVSGTATSIDFDYLTTGACILDFDFDLSARFWIAMAYNDTNATTVSCTLSPVDNDRLICKRWDKDGNRTNGDIMVLVY